MAKKLLTFVLVMSPSFCGLLLVPPPFLGERAKLGGPPATLLVQAAELDVEPLHREEDEAGAATPYNGGQGRGPRILTLLTTYSNRTAFAIANKEAMEERADGYESVVRAPASAS